MIADDSVLRGSTILAEMATRGVRVAAITTKDKLRRILDHDLHGANGSICYSAQYAGDDTLAWLGRAARPSQCSGDLSLFVLDHKHAPIDPEARALWPLLTLAQVEVTMMREEAARVLGMPVDRECHFVVIAKKNAVLGSKVVEHHIEGLDGHRLRWHGGFSE
ncbi:Fc.00g073650.m01.CDS01 [Cosmosporella sp. VM-42]